MNERPTERTNERNVICIIQIHIGTNMRNKHLIEVTYV